MGYVIGIDIGGTFTDAVATDGGGLIVAAKVPSTPPDFAQGVLDIVQELARTSASGPRRCSGAPTTSPTAPRRR